VISDRKDRCANC